MKWITPVEKKTVHDRVHLGSFGRRCSNCSRDGAPRTPEIDAHAWSYASRSTRAPGRDGSTQCGSSESTPPSRSALWITSVRVNSSRRTCGSGVDACCTRHTACSQALVRAVEATSIRMLPRPSECFEPFEGITGEQATRVDSAPLVKQSLKA